MLRTRLLAVPLVALTGISLLPSPAQAAPTAPSATIAQAVTLSTSKARTLRVATFNVRTARARSDKRPWLKRAPDVAREILSRKPGVVALQELGPGRADGKKGTLKGNTRQTTSLTNTLKRLGAGRYRLVRTTSYFAPGTKHGTQGARILYDSSRYRLLSNCPETTGKRNYNTSCAFDLPIAAGDSKNHRRSAAYAQFADRRSGQRFFVVSAHLDHRHARSNKVEARYNALRARQARAVARAIAKVNKRRLPVVFGGDINSWRTDRSRYAPARALAAAGYRDTSAVRNRVNYAYPTVNHWKVKLKPSRAAARLDVVLAKGVERTKRYENKMAAVDHARPSDHNMGVADVVL